MADPQERLQQAWALSYLDAKASLALAQGLLARPDIDIAQAQLLVCLGAVRLQAPAQAREQLRLARRRFSEPVPHPRAEWGLCLCDEFEAMLRRREGDVAGSAQLQTELDARPAGPRSAMDHFIAQNSRAITTKLLGENDASLRHLHAALDAAQQTGWPGPIISAGVNLGGRHHDLYNLEDARNFSLQGLAAARANGARLSQLVATCNLIYIHYALGEAAQAHALGQSLAELLPGETAEQVLDMTPPLALGWLAGGDLQAAETLLLAVQSATARDPANQWSLAWSWELARCVHQQGRFEQACQVALQALQASEAAGGAKPCYDLMMLHRVLSEAAEQTGQPQLALKHLREAHTTYETLVGRSARARYIALDVTQQLA